MRKIYWCDVNNPRYSFAVKRSGEGFVIRAMSDSWDDSEVSAETFESENLDVENRVFSMVASGHMQEEYGLTVFAGGFPLQLIPWDDPNQVSIQSGNEQPRI